MQSIASKHLWKPLGSFMNYRKERNVLCQLSSVSQREKRPWPAGSLTPELQLATENQQAKSLTTQMSDTINPCNKRQKHVVRSHCSRAELHQPVWKRLCLFRRPTLDSASCNLKECQSVAEVQSSLKGPTL